MNVLVLKTKLTSILVVNVVVMCRSIDSFLKYQYWYISVSVK